MTAATIAIPARLESSRLPRKVLCEVDGRPMIQLVHESGVRAESGPVVVLTDSKEVAAVVEGFGGTVQMTSRECVSGTARIASVAAGLPTELVVNLQGDAPMADPAVIARLVDEAASSGAPVTIPVYRLTSEEEVHDPNVVKVVKTHDGTVLYCSRSAIPYARDATGPWVEHTEFFGHPGLYAYQRDFIAGLADLPSSPLDKAENLEQLQFLQAGYRIHAFEVVKQAPTVDTQEELEWVRRAIAGAGD